MTLDPITRKLWKLGGTHRALDVQFWDVEGGLDTLHLNCHLCVHVLPRQKLHICLKNLQRRDTYSHHFVFKHPHVTQINSNRNKRTEKINLEAHREREEMSTTSSPSWGDGRARIRLKSGGVLPKLRHCNVTSFCKTHTQLSLVSTHTVHNAKKLNKMGLQGQALNANWIRLMIS